MDESEDPSSDVPLADASMAAELASTPMGQDGGGYPVDFVWIVVAAILVIFMQAGFALVEAGFTRAKNAVNILMKNLLDGAIGSLVFFLLGFGLMFGAGDALVGTSGFALSGHREEAWAYAFLFFQTAFAATAATIVSGAMAERTKFSSYLVVTAVMTAIVYPVFGRWAWGGAFDGVSWLAAPEGGLLRSLGLPAFLDFAGSTVVHGVGGWAALAGAIVLGPRHGKIGPNGEIRAIPGHNVPFVVLGVFILWIGWFGFNAGSTGGATGGADDLFGGAGKALGMIALNTHLAACAGAVAAALVSSALHGKPDVGLTANGALAGLVAITAGCAYVTPEASCAIGAGAGALVIGAVVFLENRGIDDPVGAVSVHGVCGAFGTLALAFFHAGGFDARQLATQAIGVASCFAWSFGASFLLFRILARAWGLRVTPSEEAEGLDLVCHGGEAYPPDLAPAGAPDPTS